MTEALVSLGTWNWFILGGLLLAAEILLPGVFLLWFGLAAIVVGLLSRVIDWSWQPQLVAFVIISIALVPAWRRFALGGGASDRINRGTENFVGRVFTLDRPIVEGSGVIRVDDTVWRVSGPDCPAGSRVRVAQAAGADLRVELI